MARCGCDAWALGGCLVAAKAAAIALTGMPAAGDWPGMIGQDAILCLGFALLLRLSDSRWLAVALHGLLVLYAGLATAVIAAIGTPPSAVMLRGLDPAMGDSAGPYLDLRTWLGPLLVLSAGALLPLVPRPAVRPSGSVLALALGTAGAVVALLGPPALPAHRNALLFFVASALPRSAAAPAGGEPTAVRRLREMAGHEEPAALTALRGAARGRNVVLVVLESASARHLRPYGAQEDPMPFVTGLSLESVLWRNAWAVYPESIKGQIALLFGTHPAPHTRAEDYAAIPAPSLATALGKAGYRTGLFHAGRFRFLGMDSVLARSGFDHRADAADLGGARESSFGIDEESVVDGILRWVEAGDRTRPFFAAYLPIAGHHPYSSPKGGPFPTDSMVGCYHNALHYADRALRQLWQGLRSRGCAHDCVLVVVGDHGEAFGEHDGNFGHTFAAYEENLHVPLLVHAPGLTDQGLAIDPVASQVDLAPTVLDLLGLPAVPDQDGSSLLGGGSRRAFAFADWGAPMVAVREGGWKLIHALDTGRDELFALEEDPGETRNVARQQPALVDRLRQAALQFAASSRARVLGWNDVR